MRRCVVPLLVGFLLALVATARADFGPAQGVRSTGSVTINAGDSLLFGSLATITTSAWTSNLATSSTYEGIRIAVNGYHMLGIAERTSAPDGTPALILEDDAYFEFHTISTSTFRGSFGMYEYSPGVFAGGFEAERFEVYTGPPGQYLQTFVFTQTALELGAAYVQGNEIADPSAPAANKGVLYFRDNGGKTELVARFPTGAIQQVAIEP